MTEFINILLSYLIVALFFLIPLAAVVFFLVCLAKYCKAKKRMSHDPDCYSEADFKRLKTGLIISAVVAGILVTIVIYIIIMLTLAIAFM